MVLKQLDIHMAKKKEKKKKNNLYTDLALFTKTTSKGITDLNVKLQTIKVLDDKIVENLGDLKFGNKRIDKYQMHKLNRNFKIRPHQDSRHLLCNKHY